MRIRKLNDKNGSVVVIAAAVVPLLVVVMAAVIWLGELAFARIKLQSACDRSAVAGASSLADSLNEIAVQNWLIHKAYRDLNEEYESDMEQNRDAARERLTQYESVRDDSLRKMEVVMNEMSGRANGIAVNLMRSNYPGATVEVEVSPNIFMSESFDEEVQWGEPGYNFVEGPSFVDPSGVEGGSVRVLKFMAKKKEMGPLIGVHAKVPASPLVLASLFGGMKVVSASAAATAFGGSIEGFALKETETVEDAVAITTEKGADELYRQTLVPVWTVGVEEASY